MWKSIVFGVLACAPCASEAAAQSCSSLPNTLTNGTSANATQVMANFNCVFDSPVFSGLVGIGATPPSSNTQLYVYSSSTSANSEFKSTNGQASLALDGSTGAQSELYNLMNGTAIWSSGINGFGTTNAYAWYSYPFGGFVFYLSTNGNATLNGTLTQLSDARLKRNVETLGDLDGLTAVERLQPVSFEWTDTKRASSRQLGFVAQQVQQVLPDLVERSADRTAPTPDGALSLNYIGLIPVLTKAIQQLKSANDKQAVELKQLHAEVSTLERRVNVKTAKN